MYNRSVATIKETKLKKLYSDFERGTPLTSQDLSGAGISADLAVHYVRSGWLNRLARGVFARPGESLSLHSCLRVLERTIDGLHVGGKTALDWYGIRQYVPQRETVQLYGWRATRLPDWFTKQFPAEYHRKRLFREKPHTPLHVAPFEGRQSAPRVSEPERAILELLSEVGVREPLQEARDVMEGADRLRADVLTKLLKACTNIKTVRLCLQLGTELSLPWRAKLKVANLPTGSNRSWVGRTNDGLLVLKPR